MDTNRKGDLAVSKIITTLTSLGYYIYYPLSHDVMADLLITKDFIKILKIQIKYSSLLETGTIPVRLYGVTNNASETKKNFLDLEKIDYIIVYCPDTDKIYYINTLKVDVKATLYLRVTPTKNNQTSNVRWAKDYETFDMVT